MRVGDRARTNNVETDSQTPNRTRTALMLTVGLSVLAFLVAGSGSAAQPKLPGSVWGVVVTGSPAKDVSWKLVSSLQRGSRLNTAVVDLKVLSAPGFVAFRSKARKLNLMLVAPRTAGKTAAHACPRRRQLRSEWIARERAPPSSSAYQAPHTSLAYAG